MKTRELVNDLWELCESEHVMVTEESDIEDSFGKHFSILTENREKSAKFRSLLRTITRELDSLVNPDESQPSINDAYIVTSKLQEMKTAFESFYQWVQLCEKKLEFPSLVVATGIEKHLQSGYEVESMTLDPPAIMKTRRGLRATVTINLDLTGGPQDDPRTTEEAVERRTDPDQRGGSKAGRKTPGARRKSGGAGGKGKGKR